MLHLVMSSVIALVIFNVSSLHPTRKGQLKLIVVWIWFPERLNDLFFTVCYSYTVESHEHLCQISSVDTCATALHCIMLNIINNLFM